MSSDKRFSRSGSFVGAGANKKVVLGWKPRSVKLVNITDSISFEKHEAMAADTALRRVQNGDGDVGNYVTLESDGFTVLAAAAVSAKTISYYADEADVEN